MKRPSFVLALAVTTAGAVGGFAAFAGCSAAPDFIPFVCAVPPADESDAGDAGDGGDGGDATDATLATTGTTGATGAIGDAGADADAAPTAYFYARQITPETCTLASISWIQCDDGIYARYYAAVDGGALTIDYYRSETGALVAHVIYPSVGAAGQCTYGPSAFTPPGCGGTQVVCCPLNADAGDAGDAGPDAAVDSGCGF